MSDHPADPASRAPRPAADAPPRAAPAGAMPADWDALARLLADEPLAPDPAPDDAARLAAARQWMAAHPDEAARLAHLDALAVAHLTHRAPAPPIDVEAALVRVKAAFPPGSPTLRLDTLRLDRPRPVPPPFLRPAWSTRRRLARAGAAAAALLAAAGLLRWQQQHRASEQASSLATTTGPRYATRVGGRDSLRLPDGTRVVLGPATTLVVAADFGTATRQVTLDGEAYFQVAHDGARPFTVRAGPAAVQDVGTAFVVRSGTAGRVTVAVTEGLVRLEALPVATGPAANVQPSLRSTPRARSTSGGRPRAGASVDSSAVLLRAGDRALVAPAPTSPGAHAAAPRIRRLAPAASPADDLAWTTGRLVFRDAPLPEVADALRRWYGVDLRVIDPALAGRHLTASFQDEPVGAVLRVVGLALGARLDRRGDTVFVRGTR